MDFLSEALLSRRTSRDYKRALAKALRMPHSKVVPFFGVFIRDLKATLNQSPSVIVVASNDEAIPVIQVLKTVINIQIILPLVSIAIT